MSLIYDYLKIDGKSDLQRHADVEIPPALVRRGTNRLNTQSLLLILGTCFISALFVFLVIMILNPGQDEPIAVDTSQMASVQSQEEQSPANVSAPQEVVVMEATENAIPDRDIPQTAQVFPETEKPLIGGTVAGTGIVQSSAQQQVIDRNKPAQPLKLVSKKRKITFPENVPVYTAPQEIAGNLAAISPGPTARDAAKGIKQYSSSSTASAAREKSKKFYQAGLQSQYKGDRRIAEIYYKKSLEAVPDHMEAMINLSAIYVQQERYFEAEEMLAQILAIEPANSKALVNMGVIKLYQDNDSGAAAHFEAALAANPLEENALVNLAYLAEKNRDYVSTEKYYRNLLQISPDNLEVLLAYGHLLEEQRRYPEAMALYGDTLKLGTVKKDQRLHNSISDRMRLLAGAVKNLQQ